MAVTLKRVTKSKRSAPVKPPLPLPEAIEPGPWDIRRAPSRREAMVQMAPESGGRLTVPLGDDEIERYMRIHEQTHIAITPSDAEAWDGVDETVLQLCEDRRVHQAMSVAGFEESLQEAGELAEDISIDWTRLKLDYRKAENARDKAGRSLKIIPPRAITAARVMAAYGTGLLSSEYGHACELDKEAAEFGLNLAAQFDRKKVQSFEISKLAAELLCQKFGTPMEPDTSEDGQTPPPPLLPKPSSVKPGSFLKELAEMMKPSVPGGKPSIMDDGEGSEFWGDMTIIEKPRPERLRGIMNRGFRQVPETRGRNLRRVSRLAQDGRVFRTKHAVRRRGGSVLIDCSGSMHLEPEEVEAIMIALPAAVIGTYNGKMDRGELWIVARDGKRATTDNLYPPYGANVVDVPALQWLNKQKGPRYWVSDGIVTERGDNHTPRVVAACHVLQKLGNIIRVPHVEQVLSREGWERVGS